MCPYFSKHQSEELFMFKCHYYEIVINLIFLPFSSNKPHESISPINLGFIYRNGCDFVEFFVYKYRPSLNRHVLVTWLPRLC